MRRFHLIAAILLLFVVMGATAQGNKAEAAPAISNEQPALETETLLEPAALLEYLSDPPENFFLVDVRTPEEYSGGHIPGAIQIDYRDIAATPPTGDKDALVIVYCRSGNRSNSAATTLTGLGYTRVLDWGGVNRWPYELVTGEDPE